MSDNILPVGRLPQELHPVALRLGYAAADRTGVRKILSVTRDVGALRGAVIALLDSDACCQPSDRRSAYRVLAAASASAAAMTASAAPEDCP